jgi:hypothetical protein
MTTSKLHDALKIKLHPNRFSDMSGKMAAIVGYILDTPYTTPCITDMAITSDHILLAQSEGDIGMNQILGNESDLTNNWNQLTSLAELTPDEHKYATTLFESIKRW